MRNGEQIARDAPRALAGGGAADRWPLSPHTNYFTRSFERLDLDFHPEISVVFERFEPTYPT